ncbi:MAG TPA: flavodoxin domain-containing protein, partial [Candidatus Bathyarchaeia archaeon]
RWGGTTGIAEKIGDTLKKEGYIVDVLDAELRPRSISLYDLVIVGSGIRADKWTKETLNFIEKNAELLKTKRTAMFVSCQMADGKKESQERAKKLYLEKTAEQYGLKPLAYGFFGGFLDFSKSHGLFVDVLVRVNRRSLRKNGLDTRKVRDTRDWNIIEVWAREAAKLYH